MIRKLTVLNTTLKESSYLWLLAVILLIVCCLSSVETTKAKQDIGSAVVDLDQDGLEDSLEVKLVTNPKLSDTDGDGLSDYEEYCKYHTDPTKKDSDADGKLDSDWEERREYTYTIRALCEIRPPSNIKMINDLYQDARPVSKKAALQDATVVEVLLFPFSTPHVYAQPYPKKSIPDSLKEYVQPTVSMNFSPEMKEEVSSTVKDAHTDVEAIEKILRWIATETGLVKYNPHWEFFHIIDNKIVWHKSLGSSEENERLLETNFFGDSMFKKKVRGTCSSMAILRGTMFRAAGLPTRLIQTLPLITRYTGDPEPLSERLRMRSMAKGYDWGPGSGGANHMYNEVFLNNHWIRVDNSIGVGSFVGDKVFVKAWSSASWNNLKEQWNEKRCFRALDVSDAYRKYESKFTKVDIAIEDKDLTLRKLPDGQFRAVVAIHNKGNRPSPSFRVHFYAGDPDKEGRKLHQGDHIAGPIMLGSIWKEATHPFSLKEGENEVVVVIDPGDEVEESDETNNKASNAVPLGHQD